MDDIEPVFVSKEEAYADYCYSFMLIKTETYPIQPEDWVKPLNETKSSIIDGFFKSIEWKNHRRVRIATSGCAWMSERVEATKIKMMVSEGWMQHNVQLPFLVLKMVPYFLFSLYCFILLLCDYFQEQINSIY